MSAVKILLSWKIKNKLAVREEMKVKIFLFVEKKYVGKRKAGNSNIFQYYSKPNNFHIHLVSEVKLDINLRAF